MAEGGNQDFDAVSVHSDASTVMLYLPESPPVINLVTPPTTPDNSVIYISPPGSVVFSDDSNEELVYDPLMLDELDYYISCASSSDISEENYAVYLEGYSSPMSVSSTLSRVSELDGESVSVCPDSDCSGSFSSDVCESDSNGSPLYCVGGE